MTVRQTITNRSPLRRKREKSAVVSFRMAERMRAEFEAAVFAREVQPAEALRGLVAEWLANPRPVNAFMAPAPLE